MSSSNKRSKKLFIVNAILRGNPGCGCGNLKLSDVVEPTPKSKRYDVDESSSTTCRRNCIAVVKDSADPLKDFKKSMRIMIVEKELYDKRDLEALLACFLELNSPAHHRLIVRAFADIWNEVVSEKLHREKNRTLDITTTCLN